MSYKGINVTVVDAQILAADKAHFTTANIGRMCVELVGTAPDSDNHRIVRRLRGNAANRNKIHGVFVGLSQDGEVAAIAIGGVELEVPRAATAPAVTDGEIGNGIVGPDANNEHSYAESSNTDDARVGTIVGGNDTVGTATSPGYYKVDLAVGG